MGDQQKLKFVIGLDLGHSYSGYAYAAAQTEYSIKLNDNWAKGFTAYKTPTALLAQTKPDFKGLAVGFKAYEEYERIIAEEENCDNFSLLHHFKDFFGPTLKLRRFDCEKCKEFDKTMSQVEDEYFMTQTFRAMFKYFVQHAIERLQEIYNKKTIEVTEVLWVVTTSTSNDQEAKLIKDSLVQVSDGLTKQNIMVGSGTTSSLQYCLQLNVNRSKSKLHTCAVINCGANTTHIALYGRNNHSSPWQINSEVWCCGSERVKHRLIHCISECCGWDFIYNMSSKYPSVWLEMQKSIELILCAPSIQGEVQCQLASAFGGAFNDSKVKSLDGVKSLKDAFQTTRAEDGKQQKSGFSITPNGMLCISYKRMYMSFKPLLEEMQSGWEEIHRHASKPQVVYLIGGLAHSNMVKQHVMSLIGDIKLIIPECPEVCPMKGAVVVGLKRLGMQHA